MSNLLATNITDNDLLDEWTIPFGNWIKQMVDWTDQNMNWLLEIIEWPFNLLIDNLVTNFLAQISWVWICLAVFAIGSLTRNVRVGTVCAMALATCGLLGQQYWLETARTIGMILVAVVLCAIVGIPLGVASGRIDGIWNAVRPAMDAMQVVHPFVYMLPVVFFWGIGVVPATMVTMVFAIPPLIRLTNLGIRQVPEDVVEASRAYGAPEWRVLTDVQLPLALPAIMTGLNQTLLMAISMLGIAAIMGAGGLGLLVFRAVNNLNVALAASAGLALFLVAVVLDRISQREATDTGNLFGRMRRAWAMRTTPELLLDEAGVTTAEPVLDHNVGIPSPLAARERLGVMISAVAALGAVVSVLLTWSNNTGLLSSYARAADEVGLVGRSFNGLSATGGSWFGIIVLGAAMWVLAASLSTLTRPGYGPRWLGVDATLFGAVSIIVAAAGYLLTRTSSLPTMTAEYSDGVGPFVALAAGVLATVGAGISLSSAPFVPRKPLADQVSAAPIVAATAALALITIGALSIWTEDKREREIMTPEVTAQIEALKQEARDNPASGPINAQKVSNLFNSARKSETVSLRGLEANGPGLGWPMLAIGGLGVLLSLPAAGVFGRDEQRRWRWSVAMSAVGLAGMMIPIAWVASLLRVADPNYVSGAGAFLAGLGSFLLVGSNKSVLELFRRSRIFGSESITTVASGQAPSAPVEELVREAVPVTAGR